MVELVEVEDESFETKNAAGLEEDEDYYTDTGTLHHFRTICTSGANH